MLLRSWTNIEASQILEAHWKKKERHLHSDRDPRTSIDRKSKFIRNRIIPLKISGVIHRVLEMSGPGVIDSPFISSPFISANT